MNIVLFRHAKKSFLPFDDPSLSPEGFIQSERLPETVKKQNLPPATALWASEKIRTHQTFQNLAATLGLKIITRTELNLRADFETQKMFQARVQSLIDELSVTTQKQDSNHVIYLCTHYDWIEESMPLIPSDKNLTGFEFSTWAPAQFVHFKIAEKNWQFIKKGQPS